MNLANSSLNVVLNDLFHLKTPPLQLDNSSYNNTITDLSANHTYVIRTYRYMVYCYDPKFNQLSNDVVLRSIKPHRAHITIMNL